MHLPLSRCGQPHVLMLEEVVVEASDGAAVLPAAEASATVSAGAAGNRAGAGVGLGGMEGGNPKGPGGEGLGR